MSDELHKYQGNLKHHKVDAPKREIASDELPMPEDASPYRQAEVSILRDGFVRGYKAALAKDSELIQRLVDDIAVLQSVFALEAGYETRWGDEGLEAAAAAGYKPTQAE